MKLSCAEIFKAQTGATPSLFKTPKWSLKFLLDLVLSITDFDTTLKASLIGRICTNQNLVSANAWAYKGRVWLLKSHSFSPVTLETQIK